MIAARLALFSEALGMCTSVSVLLPQRACGQIGLAGVVRETPPPVLYLLHGASDDDTIWNRRTSIERYAADYGLAVVMPQVNISFYSDEVHGYQWWTYLSEELPEILNRTFKISSARQDTFVAGLSMGGYGAFKLALNRPDRFAAAASLSGALDMVSPGLPGPDIDRWRQRIWGAAGITTDGPDDLVGLVQQVEVNTLPRLYLTCGTEDFLLESNRAFEAAARSVGADLTTDYRPGTHEWGFWDDGIQRVLAWFGLEKEPSPRPE